MDILAMLAALKDKVLDAGHYEILRHAYELQNGNIEQLKTNNEALKESNGLLKERAAALERDAKALREQLEKLKASLPVASSDYQPRGMALKILELYKQSGKTSLYYGEMEQQLGCSEIELSAAIRELKEHRVIACFSASYDLGNNYSLTADGEKLI